MTITKQRAGAARRNRRGGGRRPGGGRRRSGMRTEVEQLDYEMELLKAQREGREEEFKTEERAKLRAKKAQELDAEMDDYFKKKDEVAPAKEGDGKADPQDARDGEDKDNNKAVQNGEADQAVSAPIS